MPRDLFDLALFTAAARPDVASQGSSTATGVFARSLRALSATTGCTLLHWVFGQANFYGEAARGLVVGDDGAAVHLHRA